MKTKLLMGAAVAVLILAGGFALKASTDAERIAFGISMDHLEAIADNEPTAAPYCYKEASSGNRELIMICDYRTDANTIYSCPTPYFNVKGSEDRCTK